MRRLIPLLVAVALLVPVSAAFGYDAGEGLLGELNDKIITNFGFALIAGFPLLVFLLSLLQHWLDKRKERRKKAAKARAVRPEWRGGW